MEVQSPVLRYPSMTVNRRRGRRSRSRRGNGSNGDDAAVRARHACEPSDSFDSEAASGRSLPELSELTPFSIFCALYLGITERNSYARQGREAVARRFSLSRDEFQAFLEEHALDPGALSRAGFDAESARLDIQVAPEGISRVELARTIFDELRKPDEPTPV
jgi:hypothetical protein